MFSLLSIKTVWMGYGRIMERSRSSLMCLIRSGSLLYSPILYSHVKKIIRGQRGDEKVDFSAFVSPSKLVLFSRHVDIIVCPQLSSSEIGSSDMVSIDVFVSCTIFSHRVEHRVRLILPGVMLPDHIVWLGAHLRHQEQPAIFPTLTSEHF